MRVEFDRYGTYVIRHVPPTDRTALDALATAFTCKESTLSLDERGPYTEHIVDLFSRLRLATDRQSLNRSQASISSSEIKQLYKRAEDLLRQIQQSLYERYAATPEKVTRWGFRVNTAGPRSNLVLMPQTHKAVLNALEKYMSTEQSRPSAEQFTTPSLAEVAKINQDLREQREQWRMGRIVRKNITLGQQEVAQELVDYLHAALVHLVVTRFDRKVTPELMAWGYEVVPRKAALPPPNKEDEVK